MFNIVLFHIHQCTLDPGAYFLTEYFVIIFFLWSVFLEAAYNGLLPICEGNTTVLSHDFFYGFIVFHDIGIP